MTASPACRSRAVAMVQTASLARARLAPSATAARGTAPPPRTTLIPSCWLQTPARARGGCCAGRRVGCADACAGDGEGAAHGGGGVGAPRYVLARGVGEGKGDCARAPGRRFFLSFCVAPSRRTRGVHTPAGLGSHNGFACVLGPGRYAAACQSYLTLAESYVEAEQFATAVEFHGKVLEICLAAHDMVGAAETHGRLGRIHVTTGDMEAAIARHEQQVAVATAAGPEAMEQKRDGQRSLVSAYGQQAADAEKAGDVASAIATYEKCLEAARACGDVAGEGLTQHRLGMALAAAGETERAMQCQRLYRDACAAQQPPDLAGQGKACQALAAAAQAMGDTESASTYLEECIELASRAEDTAAQSRGCAALGALYRTSGNHASSVQYFEKFFELARAAETEDDPALDQATDEQAPGDGLRLADTARAALGLARGNAQMAVFAEVVQKDLGGLLAWRNRRTPLTSTSP